MKAYKEWLKENEERLMSDYEYDIHELLILAGNDSSYLEQTKSFADWSKIVYEQERDDEEYEKEDEKNAEIKTQINKAKGGGKK